jgi:hypothetical protein
MVNAYNSIIPSTPGFGVSSNKENPAAPAVVDQSTSQLTPQTPLETAIRENLGRFIPPKIMATFRPGDISITTSEDGRHVQIQAENGLYRYALEITEFRSNGARTDFHISGLTCITKGSPRGFGGMQHMLMNLPELVNALGYRSVTMELMAGSYSQNLGETFQQMGARVTEMMGSILVNIDLQDRVAPARPQAPAEVPVEIPADIFLANPQPEQRPQIEVVQLPAASGTGDLGSLLEQGRFSLLPPEVAEYFRGAGATGDGVTTSFEVRQGPDGTSYYVFKSSNDVLEPTAETVRGRYSFCAVLKPITDAAGAVVGLEVSGIRFRDHAQVLEQLQQGAQERDARLPGTGFGGARAFFENLTEIARQAGISQIRLQPDGGNLYRYYAGIFGELNMPFTMNGVYLQVDVPARETTISLSQEVPTRAVTMRPGETARLSAGVDNYSLRGVQDFAGNRLIYMLVKGEDRPTWLYEGELQFVNDLAVERQGDSLTIRTGSSLPTRVAEVTAGGRLSLVFPDNYLPIPTDRTIDGTWEMKVDVGAERYTIKVTGDNVAIALEGRPGTEATAGRMGPFVIDDTGIYFQPYRSIDGEYFPPDYQSERVAEAPRQVANYSGLPPMPLFTIEEPTVPAATTTTLESSLAALPNLTAAERTAIANAAAANGFTQIVVPAEMAGQTVSAEALLEFAGRSRSTGSRVMLVATPENFYSIGGSGFAGSTYRFLGVDGQQVAAYELREGFRLVETANDGSRLASRLGRDISRQATQIELKIMGPFYQKLLSNQRFAQRCANLLTEGATLGVGLAGSAAMARLLDEFGVQMPALRFVLEFGAFDLSSRVFSRALGLGGSNFVQGLPGLGQLHWGSALWQTGLQLTGLDDTVLAGEIPSLGAGILASRMIFNRYVINPEGMAGRILARVGIYAMLNQVVSESGVWVADKLTNGQAGQIFDESSMIAASQHPTAMTIGSAVIGRVYASMLIDLFTDSRADYESEMADGSQRTEADAQLVLDKLSAVFLAYSAAHPRSFGEVPDLPTLSLTGPSVGTLDSNYYDGLISEVAEAFSKPDVQQVVANIIALDDAGYTGSAMGDLRQYFDGSGRLTDPEGLVSCLRSRNLAEVMRTEQHWRACFAYEMFIKLAAGGDLTAYRNQGWIDDNGEVAYDNEDVMAGLAMFEEEQGEWINGRMQELIARQSMGSELPNSPLDWALGLTTLGDQGQFVVSTDSVYYQPAITAMGAAPTPAAVVETVVGAALTAAPEDLARWLEGQNIDQTAAGWTAALSRQNMGALADANGQRGQENLPNRTAIGLFRLAYLRCLRATPDSPAVEILGAYLQALEGTATLDTSWMEKAERELALFEQLTTGEVTPDDQLRLNALCLRASLLTGTNS